MRRRATVHLVGDLALTLKFVTCLSSLPNMHTLRLNLDWVPPTALAAFRNARFTQVRRLIMSADDAKILLPCCPRLRAAISTTKTHRTNLMGLFDESGETLEEIEGFMMTSGSIRCMFL
jgi:hypothetical protein